MKFLLNTNIVIDFLRGKKSIVEKIGRILPQGRIGISAISLAELYHGVYKSSRPKYNLEKVDEFISVPEISVVNLDKQIARHYGKMLAELESRGVKLAEVDILIAATAGKIGLTILTGDKKHFARLVEFGVKVEIV